jgi:hypothetical protein
MTERETDIEFDFFDEAATRETVRTDRAPGPRRRRRPPRPPAGFTPLLRLIGLVAFAILVVVLLVFWVQSCRADQKQDAYENYMEDVRRIARGSEQIGRELNDLLTTPGIRQARLEAQLRGLAQRQQQFVNAADELDAPGRLRDEQRELLASLQFRVNGLDGIGRAFRETATSRDANAAGQLLAEHAQRLVASDVIWDDLFKQPAVDELRDQDIGGVEVPDSNFIQNPDLASARSMTLIWQRGRGAATSGTPSGLHGTGIVSVKALPSGETLSESTENTIRGATDLAFEVAVENGGDSQEVQIGVTLTIEQAPRPIVKREEIDLINPDEIKTVVFRNIGAVSYATRTTLKVDVRAVPGEANRDNNTASYPVIFSLG